MSGFSERNAPMSVAEPPVATAFRFVLCELPRYKKPVTYLRERTYNPAGFPDMLATLTTAYISEAALERSERPLPLHQAASRVEGPFLPSRR